MIIVQSKSDSMTALNVAKQAAETTTTNTALTKVSNAFNQVELKFKD